MKTAELLFENSMDQYREILEKIRSIKIALRSEKPEKIKALSRAINEAHKQARETEEELDQFLKQVPGLSQTLRFDDRLRLIKSILELTEACTPKIKAVMTINRNELKKITAGRVVMQKYHNVPNCQGRLINSSG